MSPSSSPHSFRYETELCTLPEGRTLAQWRDGDPVCAAPRTRRRRLLDRLRPARRTSSR